MEGSYQKAVRVWKLMVSRTCSGALSSSSSRSSSDRLLPRAEVMAAADESDGFCLFGKLSRGDERDNGQTLSLEKGKTTPPYMDL